MIRPEKLSDSAIEYWLKRPEEVNEMIKKLKKSKSYEDGIALEEWEYIKWLIEKGLKERVIFS